ncbi:MAG TPA: TonB family protein [Gammaproteobacteria bacterium]|nr:TonB family protein [Gammaproteobacteria bacterium]
MVSTISKAARGGIPGSLRAAIGELSSGNLCIGDVRRVLAAALEEHPESGEAIQEFIDNELQARRLSISDYGELVTSLGAVLSENVPTEWSEDAPEQPDLYRIVDEGTLVLADDDEPFSPEDPEGKVAEPGLVKDAPGAEESEADTDGEDELPQIAVGDVLRDRFRLDEEAARGSMGIIYKATDLLKLEADANEPFVAIKLISPEFINHRAALKTFQNEVDNAQHLSHPNIVHLFELDRDKGRFFISMEWLEGESLDALLDRSKGSALSPAQAYAIIEQLCDALSYAHEQDVVHADVKPGNVFLTKPGELKLIDFGIARTNVSDDQAHEGDQAVALTPAYASCERLEKADPKPQDDLFSLACLIYRLLSGRRVYGAITALEAENLQMEPVRIGGMSDQRWDSLVRALAFRRVGRHASVKEFAEEFGQRRVARDEVDEDVKHTDTMTLPVLTPLIDLGDGEEFVGSADASVDFLVDESDADQEPIVAESTRELFAQPEPEPVDESDETVNIPALDPALFDEPTVEQLDPQRQQPVHAAGSIANSRMYTISVTVAACLLAAVVTWTLLPDDTPGRVQTAAVPPDAGMTVSLRKGRIVDAESLPADSEEPTLIEMPEFDQVEEATPESEALPFFEEHELLVAGEPVMPAEEPPVPEEEPMPEEELFTVADTEELLAAKIAAKAQSAQAEASDADSLVLLSQIEFLKYREPRFPRQLRDQAVSGWVDLQFTINDNGGTSNIEVIDSDLPRRFEAPSIAAVEQWVFKPYTRNGEVTSIDSAVRLRFEN